MKDEKILKKGNGETEVTKETETEDGVEGYEYCDSHGQRCMNDCMGTAVLSHLN